LRLLLDTHIALWLSLEDERLSAGERSLLLSPKTQVAFSTVSIWELRLKWNSHFISGTRKGRASPDDALAVLRSAAYEEIALTADHAAAALANPLTHKDPFDELLLVQAQEEGMRLLTRDSKLAGHPLAVMG
jgi:PIN domain nuclease of toxin-antitoxin system